MSVHQSSKMHSCCFFTYCILQIIFFSVLFIRVIIIVVSVAHQLNSSTFMIGAFDLIILMLCDRLKTALMLHVEFLCHLV